MTSLDALEEIKHTTDLYMSNELGGYEQELDIIEKDLKVLDEILAKIDEEITYCRSMKKSSTSMSEYYKGAMYALKKLKMEIEDEN